MSPRTEPPRSRPVRRRAPPVPPPSSVLVPEGVDDHDVELGGRAVRLTNLRKPFWPSLGLTKGDLLRYYAAVAPYLLPHVRGRAMVMKRYPHGAGGEFFFMKRAPSPRPEFVRVCPIEHASGNVIDFPVIDDLAGLLWLVNLGCIDLNPWYGRCDDVGRPDFLHFDLDPVPPARFEAVVETAFVVRDALTALGLPSLAKTSGSKGIHVYVPIERGPLQHDVWSFAKRLAQGLDRLRPELITSEYRKASRPPGRVLVDYNQNAWGRTLASVYSVRPTPLATVSMPVRWDELAAGATIADYNLANAPERLRKVGDLWAPMAASEGRASLERLL